MARCPASLSSRHGMTQQPVPHACAMSAAAPNPYPTPDKAVTPLVPSLQRGSSVGLRASARRSQQGAGPGCWTPQAHSPRIMSPLELSSSWHQHSFEDRNSLHPGPPVQSDSQLIEMKQCNRVSQIVRSRKPLHWRPIVPCQQPTPLLPFVSTSFALTVVGGAARQEGWKISSQGQ
jgi:hypothetical protein